MLRFFDGRWQEEKREIGTPKSIPVHDNYVEKYSVESQSVKRFSYVVALDDNKQWSCSCPSWVWSNPSQKDCKHVRHVKNWRIKQTVMPVFEVQKPATRNSKIEV